MSYIGDQRYVVYICEEDGDFLLKKRNASGHFPPFIKVPCLRSMTPGACSTYRFKTYLPKIVCIPLNEEMEREGLGHPLPSIVVEMVVLELMKNGVQRPDSPNG